MPFGTEPAYYTPIALSDKSLGCKAIFPSVAVIPSALKALANFSGIILSPPKA